MTLSPPSLQSISAGFLASIVGTASSFAVVVQGPLAVGANSDQAASGLMVLSIAVGLCAIVAAFATRMRISIAWPTPGAALLATGGAVEGGFPAAVLTFLVTASGLSSFGVSGAFWGLIAGGAFMALMQFRRNSP